MRRSWKRLVGLGMLVALWGACGGDGPTGPEVDPAIAPFVGTWDADVFTVTSTADTSIVADLLENGSFTINIQPSGTYTANLDFGGVPLSEIGTMSVAGGYITLRPNGGDVATGPYAFAGEDYLKVGPAPTDFDFNLDGDPDPATVYWEVQRR